MLLKTTWDSDNNTRRFCTSLKTKCLALLILCLLNIADPDDSIFSAKHRGRQIVIANSMKPMTATAEYPASSRSPSPIVGVLLFSSWCCCAGAACNWSTFACENFFFESLLLFLTSNLVSKKCKQKSKEKTHLAISGGNLLLGILVYCHCPAWTSPWFRVFFLLSVEKDCPAVRDCAATISLDNTCTLFLR